MPDQWPDEVECGTCHVWVASTTALDRLREKVRDLQEALAFANEEVARLKREQVDEVAAERVQRKRIRDLASVSAHRYMPVPGWAITTSPPPKFCGEADCCLDMCLAYPTRDVWDRAQNPDAETQCHGAAVPKSPNGDCP